MPRQFGVPEDVITEVLDRKLPLSAYSPYLSPIHDRHVIGINAAFLIGNWVDVCLMGDGTFYLMNRRELAKFPKLKISCNPNTRKKAHPGDNIKFLAKDNRMPFGISTRQAHVSWNGNTGAAGISLAHHFGACRIYLLGFDMKLGPGDRQHFHSHYRTAGARTEAKKLPFDRHMKGFPTIAKHARQLGLEIINVNPDSAITDFPRVSLKDII